MQKIILVGYMAVGKTTIAHLLSKKINFDVVDLDHWIEKKEGLTIPDIFSQKGEIYFRRIEHELFNEVVAQNQNTIISTGGGTPCYANNHLLLTAANVTSIYLKASLDTILERLRSEKSQRPIVADSSDEDLEEFVAKHIFERSYFYNQAQFTISTDAKTPEAIVDEISRLLH